MEEISADAAAIVAALDRLREALVEALCEVHSELLELGAGIDAIGCRGNAADVARSSRKPSGSSDPGAMIDALARVEPTGG